MHKRETISLADEVLDDSTKRAIAKEISGREASPSSRHQSDSYRFFQEQLLEQGTPYDVTRIPISVLKQMERDPMISFGLHFIRTPIMRARWYVQADDARVAAFIDNALRPIRPSLIFQYSGAWNYGFKPIVKRFQFINPEWTYLDPLRSDDPLPVWDNGSIEAIVWKTFTPLPSDPAVVEPRWSRKGEFAGIDYNGAGLPGAFRFPLAPDQNDDEGVKKVPLRKSLWFTNEKYTGANGSIYGYPRVGYAFRAWWSSWFRWALYDRFFERKADPPYVVYFPVGDDGDYVQMDSDTISTNKAIALSIAEAARSGGGIAMPGKTITGYEDRPTTIREWEIHELEVKGDMTHFVESFEYLDVMKLRALWVPEQAFLEGKGGTSSRNVASEEIGIHKEGVANEADAFDEHINRFVIPDLVAANFPDYKGECRVVTTGFQDADQKTLDSILQLVGQADPNEITNQVNIRDVFDRLGVPLISEEVIRDREKKVQEQIDRLPPPVVPEAGGPAGVTEEGFYVQAPSIITLADDSDFVATLPNSRHYSDKRVLSSTRQLRTRWRQSYADIYEDFVSYLSKQNLSLDEAEDKAEDIVDRWAYPRAKLSALISDTENIIKRVMARAGQIEIGRSNLDTEWKADNEAIAEYLEDRGAIYVKAVDDTVRSELRIFLANAIREGVTEDELINQVREHFSDFPDWKANRLVRTEIRDAYNFAQLSAGAEGGVKIVQAVDAQHGDTDHDCEEREGRFFTIGQALGETLKEHPNGTLEWIFTDRENLSIEYKDELEDGKLAYFDEESDSIYLSNKIPEQHKIEYLIQLGKNFIK
jgi:hypothetical protein